MLHRLVIETQAYLHHAWLEIVDNDIGLLDEPEDTLCSCSLLEIERDRFLGAAALEVGHANVGRGPALQRSTPCGPRNGGAENVGSPCRGLSSDGG